MEYRTLELTIISADDLKRVNFFSNMDVYVVVSLFDNSNNDRHKIQEQRTHVDNEGHNNPTWNFPMKFAVDAASVGQNRLSVLFQIRCRRLFATDKLVGEVVVPLSDLVSGGGGQSSFVSYQVKKPSGKPKGVLNFSYKFGEKFAASGGSLPAVPPPESYYNDNIPNGVPPRCSRWKVPPEPYEVKSGYPNVGPNTRYPAATNYVGPMPVHYPPPHTSLYPVPGYGYPVPPTGYKYPVQQGYGYEYGWIRIQISSDAEAAV